MNESTTFEVAHSVLITLNTEAVEGVHGISGNVHLPFKFFATLINV